MVTTNKLRHDDDCWTTEDVGNGSRNSYDEGYDVSEEEQIGHWGSSRFHTNSLQMIEENSESKQQSNQMTQPIWGQSQGPTQGEILILITHNHKPKKEPFRDGSRHLLENLPLFLRALY